MPINDFPVPGLPVLEGLRCEERGCAHLCVSEKRMRSHWVREHGRQGSGSEMGGDWKEARLQTFFRGNLLRYFTVSEEGTNIINPAALVRAQRKSTGLSSIIDVSWADSISRRILDISIEEPQCAHILSGEKDVFLFRHFISHTAATIATDSITLRLWKEAVPLLSHSHPFLLHGILAISALHLAHLTSTTFSLHSEYLLSAITHQDTAMPDFRTSIAAVTPETSHAVFTFSHLLVLYGFASESQDERLLIVSPAPDLTPTWLHFLRAGCELLCHVWDDLEAGPVKALVSAWDIPELVEDREKTAPLVERLLSYIPSKEWDDAWSEDEMKIYRETATSLARAFVSEAHGISFSTWDALRIWPMCISKEYLELVRNQHPGALILLAHYCVLLKGVEGNWYFDGRATRLMKSIVSCLDRKWMDALGWPMGEIGMIPPV